MRHRTTIVILLGMALVISACGVEGTPQASEASAAESGSEGIAVHGHWTIDVRQPDGSLDRSVSFENALTPEAPEFLARALVGDHHAGFEVRPEIWNQVVLADAGGLDFDGVSPCEDVYPIEGLFPLVNPAPFVDNACYVTVSIELGEGPDYPLVLSGSVTADRDGTIDTVETWMLHGSTGLNSFAALTRHRQSPLPIDVTAGQTVQVSVEITFGTLTTS